MTVPSKHRHTLVCRSKQTHMYKSENDAICWLYTKQHCDIEEAHTMWGFEKKKVMIRNSLEMLFCLLDKALVVSQKIISV